VAPSGRQSCRTSRRRYRPQRIRLLFVGESAPAGGTFYAENSTLYFELRAAFAKAFRQELANRSFLDLFRDFGCYLDDLCLDPVNHLLESPRRQKRQKAEESLALRLGRYRPLMVVAIGKTTAAPHVRAALERVGMADASSRSLHFPVGPNHKLDFHAAIKRVLVSARKSSVLETLPLRSPSKDQACDAP
jgi:hypothetical protein